MRRHAYVLASTLGKRHMRIEHVSFESLTRSTRTCTGAFVFLLYRHPPAVTTAPVPVSASVGWIVIADQSDRPLTQLRHHINHNRHGAQATSSPSSRCRRSLVRGGGWSKPVFIFSTRPSPRGAPLAAAQVSCGSICRQSITILIIRCTTGVLHPETLLAGDLRPTTSGPGVHQVRTQNHLLYTI